MPPASAPAPGALQLLTRYRDLVLPVGLIACVLVVVVPLPTWLMDVLLAANIAVAVTMLLTTVRVRTPLEFSVFPTLLLTTTLARLVLNVATTRLILSRADVDGLNAAGGVVQSFGQFVAGDRLLVGLILFAIIVVIQFVVITKGATRISEVAARFALDGMPGRQMAIDADLAAGVIDQAGAHKRRGDLSRQADFYGAMDGASKFVRGDAIAGMVIMALNLTGGLAIGIFEAGLAPGAAADLFTRLTIGDGLVSQLPAFLISLAAGVLVTRSTSESDLSQDFLGQLFTSPQVLAVTSGFLGLLVFTSLPALPLMALSLLFGGLSVAIGRSQQAQSEQATDEADKSTPKQRQVEDYLAVDPIELEIGVALIRLADRNRGGDLLERVQQVRNHVAAEIGIILPKVRIRDNVQLGPRQFRIKLADVPVAEDTVTDPLRGTDQIVARLTITIRRHADELLTRDATKQLIDQLRQRTPAVVDELIPGQMKLGEVQRVLQLLLQEDVPIRNLSAILEALGDDAGVTSEPEELVELVRQRLARTLSARYRDDKQSLEVILLDPEVEDQLAELSEPTAAVASPRRSSHELQSLAGAIESKALEAIESGHRPVILVAPAVRSAVRRITAARLPEVPVLSFREVTRETQLQTVAVVGTDAIHSPPRPNFAQSHTTTSSH